MNSIISRYLPLHSSSLLLLDILYNAYEQKELLPCVHALLEVKRSLLTHI